MEEDLQPYRFKISLRLIHPTTDLSICSQEFGLQPSRQWKSGDPQTSPRGNPLIGLRESSYWTAQLDTSACKDLESALEQVTDWLGSHEGFLTGHSQTGGLIRLFIGFFLESFNTGFLLEPALFAKFTTLNLGLDFDMYGQDDEPGAA
jgi:hypothetical protein